MAESQDIRILFEAFERLTAVVEQLSRDIHMSHDNRATLEAAERKRVNDRERLRLKRAQANVARQTSDISEPPSLSKKDKTLEGGKEGKVLTTAVGAREGNGQHVPKARATRLPEDWMPEAEDCDVGYDMGLDEPHVRLEFAKFKDYWLAQPGSRGTKLNWNSTFRNWLRRAADDQGRRQAKGH